jgi:hypothetical protein
MDDERWRTQLEFLEQLRAQFVRLQSLTHQAGWRAAYAANMIDGVRNAKTTKNKDLVMLGRRLLEEVRKKRAVTFVHIKRSLSRWRE